MPVNSHLPVTHMGLFSNFSEGELGNLEQYAVRHELKKGEVLFTENSFPKGVFCLAQGKVKICKLGDEGKEQIIHIAGAGEVLGFRAVFSEEQYKLSAAALEHGSYYFIAKDDFMHLMDENKGMRNAILRELSRELNDKALFITTLAQKSVRERLAYALLLLAEVYGDEPINLLREDMANYVGTATETLIRLLKEFREAGLIDVDIRKLRVVNVDELMRLAGR